MIEEFDVAVDTNGNAVVAWNELPPGGITNDEKGVVMRARFDTRAGMWATPVPLNTSARFPRVASDASGAMLAVYVARESLVRGRFFDPVSGTWQPEAAIEQNNTGSATFEDSGVNSGLTALLDGGGNALIAFTNGESTLGGIASNYFSRGTGDWVFQLRPGQCAMLGEVPGSLIAGGNDHLGLAASVGGDFLLAWQGFFLGGTEIRIARFTSRTRTWSEAQTLVPGSIQKNIQFRRNGIGSDAAGNALLVWTGTEGMRTALKAMRVDQAGATSSAVQVIDGAVGGGAAQPVRGADLGVDPQGNAIAIWQQFEGDRPDDGSRRNIAINRFDGATGTWASAVFAEAEPGNAISPSASANSGQALLAWIQDEGGANRVKAPLQSLAARIRTACSAWPDSRWASSASSSSAPRRSWWPRSAGARCSRCSRW